MKNNTVRNPLRITRICVELAVFSAFTVLFVRSGAAVAGALGWLPRLQFWPAVLALNVPVLAGVIVCTLLFGRIYCSSLCPLGIFQDLVYHIRIHSGPMKRRYGQTYRRPLSAVRYGILALFCAFCAFGLGAVSYLIEPYSIFGRAVSSVATGSLVLGAVSLATLGIITFIVLRWGRLWCNSICPVGGILGLVSRHSVFAPRIDTSKCVGCGLCGKACRASCIDTKNHRIDYSRCVDCFDCISVCREGAITYGAAPSRRGAANTPEADSGRRAFLSAAVTLGAAGIADCAPVRRREKPVRQTPVVPAGAQSLKHFADHCVRCQLCVTKCPNGVLSPSTSLQRFLLPEMNFEKGWCDDSCTVCSEVCPAGAILKITDEEKTLVSVGHAVVDTSSCLTYTRGARCGVCVRRCPKGAVRMVDGHPQVSTEQCIGCGLCEYSCPVRPVSAIHVEGLGTHSQSVFGAFGGYEDD